MLVSSKKNLAFLVICLSMIIEANGDKITNMAYIPTLESEDQVQFFLLEAPFPYNAPDTIKDALGTGWNSHATPHAGLGVWDITSGERFSIELVSNSYTGAMFPVLTTSGEILWNNSASIVVTSPIDDASWIVSSLISTTTGSAYNDLMEYLKQYRDRYATFQPINIICTNGSTISNQSSYTNIYSLSEIGVTTVAAGGSYNFVDDLLKQLWLYGSELDSYLQVYATSYAYLQGVNTSTLCEVPPSVSTEEANPEVYQWYRNLQACYTLYFNSVDASDDDQQNGGEDYLLAIKNCYANSSVAYVYKSDTEVYSVSLFQGSPPQVTAAFSTPLYSQYVFTFPQDGAPTNENLGPVDWGLIGVVLFGFVLAVLYMGYNYFSCKPKKRRPVSFRVEIAATRTVYNQLEENPDERNAEYFHGKALSISKQISDFLFKDSLKKPLITVEDGSSNIDGTPSPDGMSSSSPLHRDQANTSDMYSPHTLGSMAGHDKDSTANLVERGRVGYGVRRSYVDEDDEDNLTMPPIHLSGATNSKSG
jgi:hypothetical protein